MIGLFQHAAEINLGMLIVAALIIGGLAGALIGSLVTRFRLEREARQLHLPRRLPS